MTDEEAHMYAQLYLFLRDQPYHKHHHPSDDRPRIVNLGRSRLYAVHAERGEAVDVAICAEILLNETTVVATEMQECWWLRDSDEEFDKGWPGIRAKIESAPRVQSGNCPILRTSAFWYSDEFLDIVESVARDRLAKRKIPVELVPPIK